MKVTRQAILILNKILSKFTFQSERVENYRNNYLSNLNENNILLLLFNNIY